MLVMMQMMIMMKMIVMIVIMKTAQYSTGCFML